MSVNMNIEFQPDGESPMKVLIVDDNPLFLELSKTFLEVFHDIPSDTVDSAREALRGCLKIK